MHAHIGSTLDNCVTLILWPHDQCIAKQLPCTVYLPSLVLTALTFFLPDNRHTDDTQSDTCTKSQMLVTRDHLTHGLDTAGEGNNISKDCHRTTTQLWLEETILTLTSSHSNYSSEHRCILKQGTAQLERNDMPPSPPHRWQFDDLQHTPHMPRVTRQ